MSYTKEIKMIKELTDFYGFYYISMRLGYKTPNTIRVWLKRKTVPNIAKQYVEELYSVLMTKAEKRKFLENKAKENYNGNY